MDLRIDRLLDALRREPAAVLHAIDRDPLLVKKEAGPLVLANASQELYSPREEHQLLAKGIVYRRDPYRLVSLPLIKIYNVGEREVTVDLLARLGAEEGARVRFLRKLDGSLVQVFLADGRLCITTRGMIEGARGGFSADAEEARAGFDFLAAARRILERGRSRLLAAPHLAAGRSLIFELIHPGAPKITSYGDREDLVLIACFDQDGLRYLPYPALARLGDELGLPVVDALSPHGNSLQEQIGSLLASLAGTDEEGSVLTFERGEEVIYRVKVKSPDYLKLLRAMMSCTYERTVELVQQLPGLKGWDDLESHLRAQGRDLFPEETLPFYRGHFERYQEYRAACTELCLAVVHLAGMLRAGLAPGEASACPELRKAYAARVKPLPAAGLLFAAFDGRLDLGCVCRYVRTLDEARRLTAAIRDLGPAQHPPQGEYGTAREGRPGGAVPRAKID